MEVTKPAFTNKVRLIGQLDTEKRIKFYFCFCFFKDDRRSSKTSA
jgi:hypothetical protein